MKLNISTHISTKDGLRAGLSRPMNFCPRTDVLRDHNVEKVPRKFVKINKSVAGSAKTGGLDSFGFFIAKSEQANLNKVNDSTYKERDEKNHHAPRCYLT